MKKPNERRLSDPNPVEFQDFTLPKTIKIKKNDDLDINLTFETNILFSFPARLQNDLLFHNSNIFSIIVESCADIDFCALAFFKTWLKGDTTLHWENMSSTMLKRSWLLACLQWSVLFPPQKKKTNKIKINTSNIKCYEDFFCMLGEAFYGYRGYVGSNFDILSEYLLSIKISNEDLVFDIDDLNKLQLLLSSFSSEKNYFKIWLRLLDTIRYS